MTATFAGNPGIYNQGMKCRCGCGRETTVHNGRPRLYIRGHNSRKTWEPIPSWQPEGDIPKGLCQCGCGESAPIAPYDSRAYGWIKGEPKKFIHGHNMIEGRGYEVDEQTGCWLWTGPINSLGYGSLTVAGKSFVAHRYMYEQDGGEIPEGFHLHHVCETRRCVRPDHLEPLSPSDHSGLHASARRGETGTRAKLTNEDVHEIRSLCDQGWLKIDIAPAYGVSPSAVGKIGSRKAWAHLPEAA